MTIALGSGFPRWVWLHSTLLLLLLLGGAESRASFFTYAYEGDDGTRFLWHRDRLFGPGDAVSPHPSALEYCLGPEGSCGFLLFTATGTWDPFGAIDAVIIQNANTIMLPDGALSQVGAAETLDIDWSNRGRLGVYRWEDGYEFEYFFKDSTGQRTFRFTTPQMLLKDFVVPEIALAGCVFSPGNACVGAQLDINVAGTDAISFGNPGLDSAYFFEQTAFSRIGTHYTTGGLTSGVLTVNLVRKQQTGPGPQPDPDPGADPAPVPEPSTFLLSAAGVAALMARRIRRHYRRMAQKEITE